MTACYYLIQMSSETYLTAAAASENVIETMQAAMIMKRKMGLAVNLVSDSASVATNLKISKGQIIPFDLSSWTATTGDGAFTVVFSSFIETLKSNYTAPAPQKFQRFMPLTIFFQKPTVDKFGVIYITQGTDTDSKLTPDMAVFRFEQIVDFKIKNIITPNSVNLHVSKFDLEITRRSYKAFSGAKYVWCPPVQMLLADCQGGAPYTDITEFTTVTLKNNVLEDKSQQQKILKLGSSPPNYIGIPRRSVTGVYFLDPVLSAESLAR